MRLIHTADWHLGNKMHNIDRKFEFDAFLLWLKKEIENKKADTLVISGDVFDTVNPPTESRTQYNSFLASLLGTCCKNVIIVGGNHDSGILLDSQKDILQALNIHVVGTIANQEPKALAFELRNTANEVIGVCAAVPYVPEIELRRFWDEESECENLGDKAYENLYKQVYEEAEKLRNGKNIPIIATGHLYAANLEGRFSENETETKSDNGERILDVVGNLGSIHVGTFPKEFDYVALGHIHYPTMVAKNPKIRYSGSPFILGFDEHNIKHCVLSVEIEKDEDPKVEKIIVPETVIYKRISGNLEQIKNELNEIIKNPPEKEMNIELYYDWEEGLDINSLIDEYNTNFSENVTIVHKKRNENQDVSGSNYSVLDEADVDELTIEDIFKGLILAKLPIDKTNLSEEEIEQKQNQKVEKYLSLLLDSVEDYNKGTRYEDK